MRIHFMKNNKVVKDSLLNPTMEDRIALDAEIVGLLDLEVGFQTRYNGIIMSSDIIGVEVPF